MSSTPSSRMTSATAEMSASVLRALRRVRTDSSVRSGMMPEKILTCLTCPAITARVTPAPFRILMHLPRCPSETQWRSAPASRAAASSSGKASSLTATTVTSWPRLRAPCKHEKRKPAVAGDETNFGHVLLGRAVAHGLATSGADRRAGRIAGSNVSLSERSGAGLGIARGCRYNRKVRPRPIFGEKMRRSSVMFLSRAALLALALVGAACDNGPDTPPIPTPESRDRDLHRHRDAERRDHPQLQRLDRRTDHRDDHRDRPGGVVHRLSDGHVERRRVHGRPLERGGHAGERPRAARTQSAASLCVRLHDPNGILSTRPSPTRSRSSIHSVVSRSRPVSAGSRDLQVARLRRLVGAADCGRSRYSSITSSRRRLGRRRPTPRLDERMKFRRYCTSAQPSDGSRSICASARLVFECSR